MAKPSDKSPAVEKVLSNAFKSIGWDSRQDAIPQDKCTKCKKDCPPESFKDTLSAKEYTISGLCQECQDELFRPACDLCEKSTDSSLVDTIYIEGGTPYSLQICRDCYDKGFCGKCTTFNSQQYDDGICSKCGSDGLNA